MTQVQQLIVFFYAILNLWAFTKGFQEIKHKKNAFGIARLFGLLGIFVWGDAVVVGLFWLIICLTILLVQDWYLFLLILSIFWVVRSAGEVIYWLLEQFTMQHRNPPHTLKFYKFFNNDSIYFVYQLFWQCVLTISIVASLYLTALWFQ